jgi:hypothetical protein
MNKVYGLMSLAMLITGAVAYAVGTTPALVMAIFGTWLQWALNVVQQILKRGKTK